MNDLNPDERVCGYCVVGECDKCTWPECECGCRADRVPAVVDVKFGEVYL